MDHPNYPSILKFTRFFLTSLQANTGYFKIGGYLCKLINPLNEEKVIFKQARNLLSKQKLRILHKDIFVDFFCHQSDCHKKPGRKFLNQDKWQSPCREAHFPSYGGLPNKQT